MFVYIYQGWPYQARLGDHLEFVQSLRLAISGVGRRPGCFAAYLVFELKLPRGAVGIGQIVLGNAGLNALHLGKVLA